METIINLQKDEKLLEKEGDKYCLVSLESKYSFSKKDVENQANFAVIEIITAYKRNYEIIGEGLKMPSFHYLCVECDSLV